ncbi:uncharacterized protein LOC117512896 [Thalassophryne amazonica]|uniref:uncharacterized protein LOC117512896 n=1 Tax=Thalassophryne amazonica TaxID=390379 RepID=UPI0014718470|nr:uncharacterized protein LOC117512896 [Thalassophryne amazonica]
MDYHEQVDEIVSTAEFGDLIEFSYPVGFSHWGVYDGDGCVVHFAVADEGRVMGTVRSHLQSIAPVCGDLLLGATRIRRMPLGEINVPKGAHILISNNRHAFMPSSPEAMKQRRDALLDEKLPYRLFTLNCEHFATFVRYGKAVCNQIVGKAKNAECVDATKTFQDIVSSKCKESSFDNLQQVDNIMSTAEFGDLVEFSFPIGFSHWAVYDGDGCVVQFAVAEEGQLIGTVRNHVQSIASVCGDLFLGATRIRRMPLGEVNVPTGTHILISNNRHAFTPSPPEAMKRRRDALLDEKLPYRLFTLNCEHFATFVRYGKAVCNQIPGRLKNLECEEATKVFEDIVAKKDISEELCT